MKIAAMGVLLAGALLALTPALTAQGLEKVVKARGIEGYLEDSNGFAVQHAQVEVVSCPGGTRAVSDGAVLRTGETDNEGKFKIEDVSGGQLRCVRVHKIGFHPLMVKVKLTMFASNMKLRLERIK